MEIFTGVATIILATLLYVAGCNLADAVDILAELRDEVKKLAETEEVDFEINLGTLLEDVKE